MWNYDRALGTESVGAWWQKAQQLNGLPSISGAVPAAGRAGSTPEPWGTNLLGLECTQEHVLCTFSLWTLGKHLQKVPHGLHSAWRMGENGEWDIWCSQSRQPLFPWGRQVKLWCLCILPLYYLCKAARKRYQLPRQQTQSSLTGDSIGVNGS